MKLLLDLGNTRLKWGAWEAGAWHGEGNRVLAEEAPEEIAHWLQSMPVPTEIFLASVASEARTNRVMEACRAAFTIDPARVRTPVAACGVRCAYAEPARLGVDRWLAVVAAFHERGGPVAVFDCGTALTMDAVTEGGEHLGGLIIPGPMLMRRSLYASTSGIPDEGVGEMNLAANNTRSAITSGSLFASVAFIQHVSAEIRGTLGSGTRILLTGGDAEDLYPMLRGDYELRPRLVLEGLRLMVMEAECASS